MLLDSYVVKVKFSCELFQYVIMSLFYLKNFSSSPSWLTNTIRLAHSSNQDRYKRCKRDLFSNPVYISIDQYEFQTTHIMHMHNYV